jgi:hypothetical protein
MGFNNPIKTICSALFTVSLLIPQVGVFASGWQPRELMDFSIETCRVWDATGQLAAGVGIGPAKKSNIEVRGMLIGVKHRLRVDHQFLLELDVIDRSGQQTRFISTLYRADGGPSLLLVLNGDCSLQVARKINYTDQAQALNIVTLDADLVATGEPDWLNPPLEFIERYSDSPTKQPGETTRIPLRVGMVDSGVNYRLAEINRRLARDSDNKLIGYDFWDQDHLPYDAHPLKSKFFVQRHGTRTASLLLREAPGIELVPYRYPRPDMSRMKALVEHAYQNQVTIIGLPLGSNRARDWQAFEQVARAHPNILFIVSAGNNGRDIDDEPVYPASLDLDNMIVVTSADDFVRPAERTNWGKESVDYLIPAEKIALTDFSGEVINASGSSYAVARMTALVAKLKMSHRQWAVPDIVAALHRRFGDDSASEGTLDWVSSGYIADPLAGAPVLKKPLSDLVITSSETISGISLALNILVLDPRWTHRRIEQAVQTAYDVLAQCAIAPGDVSIHSIIGDDYLRDLSTGSARTLLEATATTDTTVVLARNTLMQEAFTGEAFGLGNTRTRPWLANSVWLMPDIEDAGIGLAHELFHVIANSGEHIEGSGNLMQSRTDTKSLKLSPEQCERAQVTGVGNRLLKDERIQQH